MALKILPSRTIGLYILPRQLQPEPLVTREHGYTTISRLIMAAQEKPMSPEVPSPEGAGQLKDIIGRLEDIDRESRDLLKKLFSMLDKDARLEQYIRRRLNDPKVSRMWELVEQVLDSQKQQQEQKQKQEEEEPGGLQLEQMLILAQYQTGGTNNSSSANYSSSFSSNITNKGLKPTRDDQDMMNIIGLEEICMDRNNYHDYVTKLERFKIKTLETTADEGGHPPPPPLADQTKD